MTCEHNQFEASVNVNRIVDGLEIRFETIIRAKCKDCGAELKFNGQKIAIIQATIED